jgi:hypothetical protein
MLALQGILDLFKAGLDLIAEQGQGCHDVL